MSLVVVDAGQAGLTSFSVVPGSLVQQQVLGFLFFVFACKAPLLDFFVPEHWRSQVLEVAALFVALKSSVAIQVLL